MTPGAYDKLRWRGVVVNRRTRAALEWAEHAAGVPISVSQGSYNPIRPGGGGVVASSGTHDGGGAVDIRTAHLSTAERKRLVRALKDAGFAAWYRTAAQGFSGPHIHALAIGDTDMAAGARAQVASFDRGRNGLRGDGLDATYRPDPRRRFSYAKNRPVTR